MTTIDVIDNRYSPLADGNPGPNYCLGQGHRIKSPLWMANGWQQAQPAFAESAQ